MTCVEFETNQVTINELFVLLTQALFDKNEDFLLQEFLLRSYHKINAISIALTLFTYTIIFFYWEVLFENKKAVRLDSNYNQIMIVLRYFLHHIIHKRREYPKTNIKIESFNVFSLLVRMVSLSLKCFQLLIINTFPYWGFLV